MRGTSTAVQGKGGLSQGCGVRPGRTWVTSVLADPEMQTRSEVLSCPRPTSSPLKKVQARMSSNSLLEILNLLINWRPCISRLSVGLDFCSKTSGYAFLLLLHHCMANSLSPLHRVRCLLALTGPMLSPERAAHTAFNATAFYSQICPILLVEKSCLSSLHLCPKASPWLCPHLLRLASKGVALRGPPGMTSQSWRGLFQEVSPVPEPRWTVSGVWPADRGAPLVPGAASGPLPDCKLYKIRECCCY